jgi:nicotinamidase-related amidase
MFSAIRTSPQYQQMVFGPDSAIHASVAPEVDDIIVTKHRVSAFAGTDLDMILRAKDIDTLILFGISTSGVVLSTLRHAADADYHLIVIKDCCADQDPEVHACLMDKLFPRQATIVSASEFLDTLKSTR